MSSTVGMMNSLLLSRQKKLERDPNTQNSSAQMFVFSLKSISTRQIFSSPASAVISIYPFPQKTVQPRYFLSLLGEKFPKDLANIIVLRFTVSSKAPILREMETTIWVDIEHRHLLAGFQATPRKVSVLIDF